MGLTNWKNAPALLAGEDTGTTPGAPALPPPPAPKLDGTPVTAASAPVRKAGLWQITTTRTFTGGNRGGGPNGGGQRGPNAGGAPGGGAPNGGGQRGPNAGGAPTGGGAPTAGGPNGGGQRGPGGPGGPGGFAGGGGRGGPPAGPVKLCVTAETEQTRNVFSGLTGRGGAAAAGCEPKLTKTDNGYQAATACTTSSNGNPVQNTSKLTLTGDLNTRYSISGTTSSKGGQNGDTSTTVRVTASYVGACPAGQKGGDQTSADGTVRNIFDAPQGGGGRRGGGGGFGG